MIPITTGVAAAAFTAITVELPGSWGERMEKKKKKKWGIFTLRVWALGVFFTTLSQNKRTSLGALCTPVLTARFFDVLNSGYRILEGKKG